MIKVQNGNTVKIHYTGTLGDGSIFDSSDANHPLAGKDLRFELQLVAIS